MSKFPFAKLAALCRDDSARDRFARDAMRSYKQSVIGGAPIGREINLWNLRAS